jgi:hypothetical protein
MRKMPPDYAARISKGHCKDPPGYISYARLKTKTDFLAKNSSHW